MTVDMCGRNTDARAMSCTDELMAVAQVYADAEGIKLKTVSWRLFQDTAKLAAILRGADLQTRRFEGAMRWLSENWPAHAIWPEGVGRPVITSRSDVAA
jgi:hypothetical protein